MPENALRESEERYRLLFNNLSEGFAVHEMLYDAAGQACDYRFLEVNPAFERLTGLKREHTVGRTLLEVLPDSERFWIEKYAEVVATGIPARFERLAELLGRRYEVHAFRLRPGQFAALFFEVTDRKRVEEALRQKEKELKEAQRLALVGSWYWDAKTDANTVSDELLSTFGQACPPFQEQKGTMYPPESWGRLNAAVQRAVHTGVGYELDLEALRGDGATIWVTTRGEAVRDASGIVVGLRGTVQDISERKRVERLYAVLSQVNEAIVRIHDEETLNQEVCRIVAEEGQFPLVWIGFTEGEDVVPVASFGTATSYLADVRVKIHGELGRGPTGTCIREGRPVINDDFDSNATTLPWRAPALRHGFRASAAFPLRRGEEAVGALALYATRPAVFDAAQIRLLEALSADLSYALDAMAQERRRVEAERALRESEQSLREVDERKNEFLAVLSHELRNPLAPIKNSLYILDRATPGGAQAERAKAVINRQVEQLSRLVDDLLDVTRIARNKIRLERQRVDLNHLAERALDDQRSLFEKSGVRLELELGPLPVHVSADPARLTQVIGNLLQNAAKFTPPNGRTCLSVGTEPAGKRATLRVADNGVGMTPETLARMFEPFMQADKTLDRSLGGLGLGLALVKGLVALHGGEVNARSEGLGKGAELVVCLPLEPASAVEAPEPSHAPKRRRRRVLVIEDNVDAADTLRDALEFGEHEVALAYNGPEGLAKALEFRPEVVLCDIGLPGMDGYEVARAFRADEKLKGSFLVALSGYALPEDLQRASAAGFERHLAKPPSLQALEELLAAPQSEAGCASEAPDERRLRQIPVDPDQPRPTWGERQVPRVRR
jgi:two-component system CheB/CheR fusion protein